MPENSVKSADRVLTLLEMMGGSGRDLSHTELVEALDIPKSSLSQLLKNLVARNWVSYTPASKTYALGDAIVSLARRVGEVRDLTSAAPDVLARLTEATTETSALNFRKGDETEVAATELSPHRLLSLLRLGDHAPLYATSGGKAILAFLPEAAIEDYLSRVRFEAITPNTLRSKDALWRQLAQIKSDGFARSFEEFTPGVVGVARPVLDRQGHALASVNVALPAIRYSPSTDERIRREIAPAVDELLRKCGR